LSKNSLREKCRFLPFFALSWAIVVGIKAANKIGFFRPTNAIGVGLQAKIG